MRPVTLPLLLLLAAALGFAGVDGAARAQTATDGAEDRPRLGEGSFLDYRDAPAPAPGDTLAELDSFLDGFMARPALDFRRTRLQDLLRKNLLLEDENARRVSIFKADSTLALDLYQLRGDEYPHYHPYSDLWIYVWRGRGNLQLDEEQSSYEPGELLQIPAGRTYALQNLSGAPTVALVWQRPPVVDSLTVEFIPEEVLEQMRLDSLRSLDLQERSLYRPSPSGR